MHNGNKIGFALALTAGLLTATAASAALTVLHTFCPSATCTGTQDGEFPAGAPVKDGNKLYGTTEGGGANGVGTVYRYNVSNTNYADIFDFASTGTNLYSPEGALIEDTGGNLYGTAKLGGAHGHGGVYKLNAPGGGGGWTITTIYSFCTTTSGSICTDGDSPRAGLTYAGQAGGSQYDGTSLLFGNTFIGGANDHGAVFALQLSGGVWSEKVIHDFAGATTDGQNPTSSMWMDGSNNIFGTTLHGGSASKGFVFELTPGMNQWTNAWTETAVYNMCWTAVAKCPDGNLPTGLIMDGSGNIYAAAELGGNGINPSGGGTFFKLDNPGGCTEGGVATFWCLTVIHNFCTAANCTDGYIPAATTNPVEDASGNFYGVTSNGGTGAGGFPGGGTLYKITSAGAYSVLASFCTGGCGNGETPISTPVWDGTTLYGATQGGGDATNLAGVLWSF
ncbi:MAG: hypothetical protein JOZ72_14955 [Alphaproteobacteria bacterium]|nr:hypothetical protein [Alphaproteobacteria bacterium]